MDSKTYIANAIKTESVPAALEINPLALHAALVLMTSAAEVANQIKRKLFYGKPIEMANIGESLNVIANTADMLTRLTAEDKVNDRAAFLEFVPHLPDQLKNIDLNNLNIRLVHGALGIFSESGEMLEALVKQFETGELDAVNFGEENGDVEWYQSIIYHETGVSEEAIRTKNIAKLTARYPDKFTAEAALNRDLVGERAILEAPTP